MPSPRSAARRARRGLLVGLVAALAVGPAAAGLAAPSTSDPLPASRRLPDGWALDPAGTQVLTSRGTTGVTVAPGGRTVYAVTSGIFEETLASIDAATLVSTPTVVGDAYQGVAADAAGDVFVSGGPHNGVYVYRAVGPAVLGTRPDPAPAAPNGGIPVTGHPGNMVLAGSRLFVAGTLSVPNSVAERAGARSCAASPDCSVVNVIDDPAGGAPTVHAISVGRDAYGLAYRPASHTLYVSNWADQTNQARGGGRGTVSVATVRADGSGAEQQVVPVGMGPAGMALSPDGSRLAVANSGDDSLSILSLDRRTGRVDAVRTVSLRVVAGAPLGTTPLAVSFRAGRLFVALAGIDAIEVLTVDGRALPQHVAVSYAGHRVHLTVPATFIPTGWYPDALAFGPRPSGPGERLYVANLRGVGSGPGYYPQLSPLVGSNTEGSVSAIDLAAGRRALSAQLRAWTAQVVQGDQLAPVYDPRLADPAADACLPVPLPGGGAATSRLLCSAQQGRVDPRTLHVVVILAENKTFDSYFGDITPSLGNADADPQWTEYGQPTTTNQHLLSRAFALDDNFWNEGAEASTLGHSWLTGGYTTPDRELTWGQAYDLGLRGNRPGGQYAGAVSGPSDPAVAQQESVMQDPRERVADQIADPATNPAGLTERIYSTDLNEASRALADRIPTGYWGLGGPPTNVDTDLAFPDVDRAGIFLHGQTVSHAWDALQGPPPPTFGKTIGLPPGDRSRFTLDAWDTAYRSCRAAGGPDGTCQRKMPNYIYMTLSENHTYDLSNVFNPLDPTPQSMVADNDYAIGLIVQALSRSPFWDNTVVFLTEDDNQFTGDHVDVHRTFLLTMGGLARRLGTQGRAATQLGSFPSVLKTTEILLHLPPLTLFDWRAAPMAQMIGDRPDQRGYTAVLPTTPFLSAR